HILARVLEVARRFDLVGRSAATRREPRHRSTRAAVSAPGSERSELRRPLRTSDARAPLRRRASMRSRSLAAASYSSGALGASALGATGMILSVRASLASFRSWMASRQLEASVALDMAQHRIDPVEPTGRAPYA